uniref:Phospholipase D/Transphosphatidylase n=1 Tax=Dechloromonas aromatica (strain RCB) TaxID=159087 RepID=Q47J25_DECAR
MCNWAKIGQNVVTEQIYIHSKLMVVDDRFALLGSANVNDRSLLGERDSEIAVLVIDTDISWRTRVQNGAELLQSKALLQSIAAGLRPRQLFDVPSEPGLCLPYVFVPDNGQEKHAIAMTYRLKEHPDITINLKSETAEPTPEPGGDIRPDAVTNDFRTDLYWGAKVTPSRVKSARSIFHAPARRSLQLDGRPGQETFLAVVRKNATEEDYIYLAVARGNPDTPEAAPDIRFFVEQERENAIKRGIKPLTQDEVLKLARQIAASVGQRRGQ